MQKLHADGGKKKVMSQQHTQFGNGALKKTLASYNSRFSSV